MKAMIFGLAALMSIPLIGPALAEERATAAMATPAEPRKDQPGYVSFSELAAAYGEPRVMINIGSSLLRLASAMDHKEPLAAAALSRMESVRVHVYDTHGQTGPASERMNAVASMLVSDAWEPIVRVRESGEQVEIFVMQNAERIQGITVMAVDGEEAVFINVLGDIDPSELSGLLEHVDVDMDLEL